MNKNLFSKSLEFPDFAEFVSKYKASQLEVVINPLEFDKKIDCPTLNRNQGKSTLIQDKINSQSYCLQGNSTKSTNSKIIKEEIKKYQYIYIDKKINQH